MNNICAPFRTETIDYDFSPSTQSKTYNDNLKFAIQDAQNASLEFVQMRVVNCSIVLELKRTGLLKLAATRDYSEH